MEGLEAFPGTAIADREFDSLNEYQQMMKLDDHVRPGLTPAQTAIVIVRCECTRYMTRFTYASTLPSAHYCRFKPINIDADDEA